MCRSRDVFTGGVLTFSTLTPFLYDPSLGENLLIEISFDPTDDDNNGLLVSRAGSGYPKFFVWDGPNLETDPSVFSVADNQDGFDNTGRGLRTEFITSAVPEPASALLLAAGLALLSRHRPRSRAAEPTPRTALGAQSSVIGSPRPREGGGQGGRDAASRTGVAGGSRPNVGRRGGRGPGVRSARRRAARAGSVRAASGRNAARAPASSGAPCAARSTREGRAHLHRPRARRGKQRLLGAGARGSHAAVDEPRDRFGRAPGSRRGGHPALHRPGLSELGRLRPGSGPRGRRARDPRDRGAPRRRARRGQPLVSRLLAALAPDGRDRLAGERRAGGGAAPAVAPGTGLLRACAACCVRAPSAARTCSSSWSRSACRSI